MALIAWDGFDTYANLTTDAIAGIWSAATVGSISASGRFSGSRCVNIGASNNSLRYTFASSSDAVTVGFAINYSASPAATGTQFCQFENAGAIVVQVGVDSAGAVRVGRADFTTNLISQSANAVLSGSAWHYLEIELVRSATVGEVRIRVDGALVINDTGKNTGASTFQSFAFRRGLDSTLFDDWYFGGTATDHTGDVRVETLFPNGDTAQRDWGRSTGATNYTLVDEQPQNGDTDYVTDSTVGHKDLYDCADLSSTPATVFGVATEMVARKDDATARTIRNDLKSGATTSNGITRTLSTTYQIYKDFYLTNPDTSTAWTATTVNAAQVGPEVVT